MSEQDAADEEAKPENTGESVDIADAPEDVDTDEINLEDVAAAEVDEELQARVEDASPADIARELAALRNRTDSLETQVEELDAENEALEEKLKRKQAEFQNYKKRMQKRRKEEKERATEELVTRILDVRDNLERALEQDEDTDIRSGVESTLRQLDDVLQAENVVVIDPEPGEDVDPTQHQVLANVDSEEEPGTIADVHRPGYEMAEKVLREAQVTVSEE